MSGLLGLFSSGPDEKQQRQCVEQLRGRFDNEDVSEECAERFLEVRGWNVDGAAVMLSKTLAWRRENLPVTWDEVRPVMETGVMEMLDDNAEGHAVWLINLRRLLLVDWSQDAQMHAHIRASVYCAETMANRCAKGTWIAVVNCTGIRMPPHVFMTEFAKVLQANYPGRLHQMLMYPVPRFIVGVVKSFMVMLPAGTSKKVAFLSSFEDLSRQTGLSQKQLPDELADPTAPEALKGARLLEIPAGKTDAHTHFLATGRSVEWSFRVVDHTVKFHLGFIAGKDQVDVPGTAAAEAVDTLIDEDRVEELAGEFTAKSDGILKFTFDNSSSYFQSKSVILSCVEKSPS